MWRDKPLDFVATDISLLVEQVNFFRIRHGTLKGNEKLQVFVFFLEKMRHRVTFLLGKENWSSNGYSVRIADRKK